EIAGLDEAPVQRVHPRLWRVRPMIETQRTKDALKCPRNHHARTRLLDACKAPISRGVAKSSGIPAMPCRRKNRPAAGLAVNTVNGTASTKPDVTGKLHNSIDGETIASDTQTASPNRSCGQSTDIASDHSTPSTSRR